MLTEIGARETKPSLQTGSKSINKEKKLTLQCQCPVEYQLLPRHPVNFPQTLLLLYRVIFQAIKNSVVSEAASFYRRHNHSLPCRCPTLSNPGQTWLLIGEQSGSALKGCLASITHTYKMIHIRQAYQQCSCWRRRTLLDFAIRLTWRVHKILFANEAPLSPLSTTGRCSHHCDDTSMV